MDRVIYLLDEQGETLIQKAAHGPKNPVAQDILNPITIPVGEGIVGAVAKSGQIEWVEDTQKFAQLLGGDLKVESVLGKGSTFSLNVNSAQKG